MTDNQLPNQLPESVTKAIREYGKAEWAAAKLQVSLGDVYDRQDEAESAILSYGDSQEATGKAEGDREGYERGVRECLGIVQRPLDKQLPNSYTDLVLQAIQKRLHALLQPEPPKTTPLETGIGKLREMWQGQADSPIPILTAYEARAVLNALPASIDNIPTKEGCNQYIDTTSQPVQEVRGNYVHTPSDVPFPEVKITVSNPAQDKLDRIQEILDMDKHQLWVQCHESRSGSFVGQTQDEMRLALIRKEVEK